MSGITNLFGKFIRNKLANVLGSDAPDEAARQAREEFKKEFSRDVYHGQGDTATSIGVIEGPEEFYGKQGRPLPGGQREIMVEDPLGEYGGITAFESSEDKLSSTFMSDLGTWVSESPRVADHFAGSDYGIDKAGAIYPLKLKMKNPKEYQTYEELEFDVANFDGDNAEFVEALKKEGHDGIMINESDTDIPETRVDYVVFDGSQLRSRFAEFDPEMAESRDIRKADGGPIDLRNGIGKLFTMYAG